MKFEFGNSVITLGLALGILTFEGCQKTSDLRNTVEDERQAAATPEPVTRQPKAAPPVSAPASTPPIQPSLAPEGVYFLTAAVSIQTPDGITGLPPGTRAVKQADGRYLADGQVVELRADQLTNDLRVAAKVASADRTAQSLLQPRVAKPTPAPAKRPADSRENEPYDSGIETTSATGRDYVPGVKTQPSGLQTGSTLGGVHSRTADGYLWQKTPDGKFWTAVKRLDGKLVGFPPDVPVR